MNYMKFKTTLLLSLLLFMVTPYVAMAAPNFDMGVNAATDTVTFRVAYNDGVYEVYMTPSMTPDVSLTLTSQVTLKVPHSKSDSFTVANVTGAIDGTAWALTSRVDAPEEDANADYLSFEVSFPDGNFQAIQWKAGEEIKVFTFETTNACLGAVNLMAADDAFASLPNSANTNPGNQIDVLGSDNANLFGGVMGESANCATDESRTELSHQVYLPFMAK